MKFNWKDEFVDFAPDLYCNCFGGGGDDDNDGGGGDDDWGDDVTWDDVADDPDWQVDTSYDVGNNNDDDDYDYGGTVIVVEYDNDDNLTWDDVEDDPSWQVDTGTTGTDYGSDYHNEAYGGGGTTTTTTPTTGSGYHTEAQGDGGTTTTDATPTGSDYHNEAYGGGGTTTTDTTTTDTTAEYDYYDKLQKELEAATNDLEAQKEMYGELSEQYDAAKIYADDLQAKLDTKDTTIIDLQGSLDTKLTEIGTLEKQITGLENDLEAQKEMYGEQSEQYEAAKTALETAKESISTLTSETESLQEIINARDTTIQEKDQTIKDLKSRYKPYADALKDAGIKNLGTGARSIDETTYNQEMEALGYSPSLEAAARQQNRINERLEDILGDDKVMPVFDASGNVFGLEIGGTRTDYDTARAFAQQQGVNFGSDAFPDRGTGIDSVIKDGINSVLDTVGISRSKNFVVDYESGYIGEVTDDYALTDALINLSNLFLPTTISVDRAKSMDVTGRGMGERYYEKADMSLFGASMEELGFKTKNVRTPEEQELYIASLENRSSQGSEDDSRDDSRDDEDQTYAESVAKATGRRSSALLPYLLAQNKAAMTTIGYTDVTDPFAKGAWKQKMAEGGVAENIPDDMKAAIRENPLQFLQNPLLARDEAERKAMYSYNEKVLGLAKKPLRAQMGMQVGSPQPAGEGTGPVGFVGNKPEEVSERTTIADDVAMDVEDGTFVINAAAVEKAGSSDIKDMILEAIDEAEKQGIDIKNNAGKIDREKSVSLLVSRGEVIIPPALAKIIGYDRLEKINNRGKPEVQERVEESDTPNSEAPPA